MWQVIVIASISEPATYAMLLAGVRSSGMEAASVEKGRRPAGHLINATESLPRRYSIKGKANTSNERLLTVHNNPQHWDVSGSGMASTLNIISFS